jgi:alpha-ketoglutarate-dependent taurine dioxygenase
MLQSRHNEGRPASPFPSGEESPTSYIFENWFDSKLARYQKVIGDLVVEIDDPTQLSSAEHSALVSRVADANMVIYQCRRTDVDQDSILQLAQQVGLRQLDANLGANATGLTEIRVRQTARLQRYIPYSARRLNWHTDGYYQPPSRRIRGMLLHCMRDADGGENFFIDHEIVFGLLYRENPAWVTALSHPKTMTIPANDDAGGKQREAQSGPVFEVDSEGLNMRYTARQKNICWRDKPLTQKALAALKEILNNQRHLVVRHHLCPGQGVLSNNLLHGRQAFNHSSETPRFLYRGRFLNSVNRTLKS